MITTMTRNITRAVQYKYVFLNVYVYHHLTSSYTLARFFKSVSLFLVRPTFGITKRLVDSKKKQLAAREMMEDVGMSICCSDLELTKI